VLLSWIGISASAAAADAPYYVGARFSYDNFDDLPIDAGPILGDLSVDRDWGFGAVIGRQLSAPFRVELDVMFQRGDAEELPALALSDLSGRVNLRTVMVNLVADLPVGDASWQPYAGVGAGWAGLEIEQVNNGFLRIDGEDDSAIAAQGFVGIAVPISDAMKLTFDARYTYVRANGVSYDIGPGVAFDGDTRLKAFGVGAGLQFSF
jgi:Outer membrane protein beta-barrel domain